MQVAAARRGFAPLRYWDGPGRGNAPRTRNPQAAKTAAQPVIFFTHPTIRYGTTAAPKHTVGGPAHHPAPGRPAAPAKRGAAGRPSRLLSCRRKFMESSNQPNGIKGDPADYARHAMGYK